MRTILRPSVVLLAAMVAGVLGLTAAGANVGGAGAPGATGYTFAAIGDQPPQRGTVLPEPSSDTNAVIGVDERVQVTDTVTYPGGAIAFLETYRGGLRDGSCTGTFIGPDVLLTAAHCLYLPDLGWVENIAVVPGKNGALEPFGYDWALDWWVPDAWISTGILGFDWGVIKMPSDVLGNTVGWLTVANLKTDTLSRTDFSPSIIGYPGDKPPGTMWVGLKAEFALVKAVTLEYEIDTAPGQSGAAIISGNLDEWFGAYVVGIHTYGGSLSDSGSFNSGQRIDAFLLSDILSACTVMDCSISFFEETQATQTPTPTTTPPPGPSATPTPTSDTVPTITPTATIGATSTPRPTIARAPTWTPGPTWTPQPTWTPNVPPTATPTPTFTSTPTNTPTNTPTSTPSALRGDTSCDGVVNPLDAALILQLSAGLLAVLPCPGGGDTNDDGSVNPLDAALILQFSAGLISSLPP